MMFWLTRVCPVALRFEREPQDGQVDHPHRQKGRQE